MRGTLLFLNEPGTVLIALWGRTHTIMGRAPAPGVPAENECVITSSNPDVIRQDRIISSFPSPAVQENSWAGYTGVLSISGISGIPVSIFNQEC
jgi:hypothetical protein